MPLPPPHSRRWFLRGAALTVLGAACTGPGDGPTDGTDGTDSTDDTDLPPCPDPLSGGTLLATLPFDGEDDQAVGQQEGEELNGRLAFDHSALDADSLITPTADFFIRTLPPRSLPSAEGWQIQVEGLAAATSLAVADLLDDVEDQGVLLMECSGNRENRHFGLMSAAQWAGVPLQAVLDRLDLDANATSVEVSGYDEHVVPSSSGAGCSWIFTIDQLLDAGAFLATEMNGAPLPVEHGAPIRLMVPGWYGCTCAKWLNRLRFTDDAQPATSQMLEFASRTHQPTNARLASDFRPARMQVSAMPIRVEQWDVDGAIRYRIVGIVWGGDAPVQRLELRTEASGDWEEVEICPEPTSSRTWTLWQAVWDPQRSGRHILELRAPDDDSIRLELGWYARAVTVA
ncbi:MAG: molybdopterin-dependent oxidoreductase [Myxococcota bacterium]